MKIEAGPMACFDFYKRKYNKGVGGPTERPDRVETDRRIDGSTDRRIDGSTDRRRYAG
jgi:hypothetical protein